MEKKVYERHIKNQKTHWWFSVRRELISKFIKKYSKMKKLKILDYGCGSGTNIKALTKFGDVYCYEKDKRTLLNNIFALGYFVEILAILFILLCRKVK